VLVFSEFAAKADVEGQNEPLPGLRRVEVWGSPFVDWTRLAL
jgi:hypothetical protein